MAKVLNKSGRYISQKVVEKRRAILAFVLTVTAGLFSTLGIVVGMMLRKSPLWMHILTSLAFIGLLRLVFLWTRRRIEGLEREQVDLREQFDEGSPVGLVLKRLPDDFRVINSLHTPTGNVEQVVVGASGIFLLETINWKGEVSSDGKGELLWFGYPTDTPLVTKFGEKLAHIMTSLRLSVTGPKIQIQPVFVFTDAQLNANLAGAQPVLCLSYDQLHDHLVSSRAETRLNEKEIETIAQAFVSLTGTDTDLLRKRG